jgi:PAS domain S-box-containing protein
MAMRPEGRGGFADGAVGTAPLFYRVISPPVLVERGWMGAAMVHSAVAAVDAGGMQRLVDSITDHALIQLDRNAVVRGWHAAAEAVTGYPASEAVGEPITLLYTDGDVASRRATSDLRQATEKGRHEFRGWLVRRDGSRFWASTTFSPLHADNGPDQGYLAMIRDLTESRGQELALLSIEQMVDAITDYEVIRLDNEGVILSWNEGARRLKGYEKDEIIGRHASVFYTEQDIGNRLLERELDTAVRTGRVETEGWRVRKDGSQFWCNMIMGPIRDSVGEMVGFVRVGRDLTEQREQARLVQRQRDEILELSTPVIQVWDNVLVLPVIGTLDSVRAARLTEALLERIAQIQAEVVILDISGVPAIDTDVAQHMLRTVEAARLMGTTSVLSGVRPETAQAIVHLGIDLGTLRSRNSLKDALQLALTLVGAAASDRVSVDA